MNATETLDVDGRDLPVYVARPGSDDGPGLLLVHAWWGFNECFRELCDRLAAEGLLVVAPDLCGGEVASTIEEADAASSSLDPERAFEDAVAAFDLLCDHGARSGGLGVLGVSMGVGYALAVVRARPTDVDAGVAFYGIAGGEYGGTDTAFLGHFAEDDAFQSVSDVEALRERLEEGEGPVTFHTYPGTEHWFLEPDRPEYDEDAARLAWSRTVEFLRAER